MKATIRFYDNDQTHIDNVKVNRHIECIKVDSQLRINEKERIPFIEEMRRTRKNRFFNVYIETIIQKAIARKTWPVFNYDQSAGIRGEAMMELIEWAELGGEVVIFDLDRTIIMTEGYGIFFKNKTECDDIFSKHLEDLMQYVGVKDDIEATIHDFIVYICGGQRRLEQLQDMFSALHELGVKIYINTMNTACVSPLFREVLDRIIVVPYEVQCSDERGGKLHQIINTTRLRGILDDEEDNLPSPSKRAKK
jgi:hypothetical protein